MRGPPQFLLLCSSPHEQWQNSMSEVQQVCKSLISNSEIANDTEETRDHQILLIKHTSNISDCSSVSHQ